MSEITVVIPVGPYPANQAWLQECLDSVQAQTLAAAEVLLIDDMAGLSEAALRELYPPAQVRTAINIDRLPWRTGVAGAFNAGVGLARTPLVFMLGSDDRLMPECLERCQAAWEKHKNHLGFYWVDLEYSDGEQQALPCNAAMVTKDLWRWTGGFAPETAIGAPDAALVSIMLKHGSEAGELIHVESPRPLYWARRHSQQDTAGRGCYQGAILQIRDILTENWHPAKWGRYE